MEMEGTEGGDRGELREVDRLTEVRVDELHNLPQLVSGQTALRGWCTALCRYLHDRPEAFGPFDDRLDPVGVQPIGQVPAAHCPASAPIECIDAQATPAIQLHSK